MNISQKVNEIFRHFDFEKVRALMVLVGWKWGNPAHVPSIEEMKNIVSDLILDMINVHKTKCFQSGGFSVETDGETISVSFVLEEYKTIWSILE